MIQYIEKLFQETKTIILPGLGALTVTNPDSKELMFMPFLKHDDGVLSGFIEKEAGISNEDARKMVSDEVKRIEAKLESNQTVSLGDYGSFKKEADGEIVFEKVEDSPQDTVSEGTIKANPSEEASTGEDELSKSKVDDSVEASTSTQAEKEPAVTTTENRTEEKQSEKTPTEQEKVIPIKTDLPKESTADSIEKTKAVNPEKEDSSPAMNLGTVPASDDSKQATSTYKDPAKPSLTQRQHNILEKEEIAANQKKLDDLRKLKEAPKKTSKRGAGFYILIALLLLIVGGGTYVGLNYNSVKEYIPFLAEDTAVQSNLEEEKAKMEEMVGQPAETVKPKNTAPTPDSISVKSTSIPEETKNGTKETALEKQPEPEMPPKKTERNNDQPFHIVAGVFSSPENAGRLAEKIRKMGYPAKTFERGAQTVVSVQSFATSEEAQNALATTKDAAPSGWVLEWR